MQVQWLIELETATSLQFGCLEILPLLTKIVLSDHQILAEGIEEDCTTGMHRIKIEVPCKYLLPICISRINILLIIKCNFNVCNHRQVVYWQIFFTNVLGLLCISCILKKTHFFSIFVHEKGPCKGKQTSASKST